MRHASREDCNYQMFWKLFNYISGQNERELQIPMTAPVSVLVEPGPSGGDGGDDGQQAESTFTMAFYIPPPYDQDPPRANDPTVSIELRPEMRLLARYTVKKKLYIQQLCSVYGFAIKSDR